MWTGTRGNEGVECLVRKQEVEMEPRDKERSRPRFTGQIGRSRERMFDIMKPLMKSRSLRTKETSVLWTGVT